MATNRKGTTYLTAEADDFVDTDAMLQVFDELVARMPKKQRGRRDIVLRSIRRCIEQQRFVLREQRSPQNMQ